MANRRAYEGDKAVVYKNAPGTGKMYAGSNDLHAHEIVTVSEVTKAWTTGATVTIDGDALRFTHYGDPFRMRKKLAEKYGRINCVFIHPDNLDAWMAAFAETGNVFAATRMLRDNAHEREVRMFLEWFQPIWAAAVPIRHGVDGQRPVYMVKMDTEERFSRALVTVERAKKNHWDDEEGWRIVGGYVYDNGQYVGGGSIQTPTCTSFEEAMYSAFSSSWPSKVRYAAIMRERGES
jgi:hypothetical protein